MREVQGCMHRRSPLIRHGLWGEALNESIAVGASPISATANQHTRKKALRLQRVQPCSRQAEKVDYLFVSEKHWNHVDRIWHSLWTTHEGDLPALTDGFSTRLFHLHGTHCGGPSQTSDSRSSNSTYGPMVRVLNPRAPDSQSRTAVTLTLRSRATWLWETPAASRMTFRS